MKKKILRTISIILLVSFVFLSQPGLFLSSQSKAFFHPQLTFDIGLNAGLITYSASILSKEFWLDVLARVIGRNLLSQLSNRMISKIQNGGREGGPAFVQDWRSFILGGQYRGEDVFRGILYEAAFEAAGGKGVICPQFKDELGKIFNAAKINLQGVNKRVNSLQSYAVQAKCTLPKNIENFYEDFSRGGGWEAFLRTLEPQNTMGGAIALSERELNKQRQVEEKADIQEAVSGSGYTGLRTGCEPGHSGPNKKCAILGKIVTPPDILGTSAAKTIDAELDWLTSSDEISEILVGVANTVLQRVTGEILGEVGLAGAGRVPENAQPEELNEEQLQKGRERISTPTPTPTPEETQIDKTCYTNCFNNQLVTCLQEPNIQACTQNLKNQCINECPLLNP